jgi:hypothetical protein
LKVLNLLLREMFAARGKTATRGMVRVVQDSSGKWIPFQQWKAEQDREALEIQRRMAASKKEPYDYTYKAPSSQKLPYDFSY